MTDFFKLKPFQQAHRGCQYAVGNENPSRVDDGLIIRQVDGWLVLRAEAGWKAKMLNPAGTFGRWENDPFYVDLIWKKRRLS